MAEIFRKVVLPEMIPSSYVHGEMAHITYTLNAAGYDPRSLLD